MVIYASFRSPKMHAFHWEFADNYEFGCNKSKILKIIFLNESTF